MAELTVLWVLYEYDREENAVLYTDGYVHRGYRLDWVPSARFKGKVVGEQSGAYRSA